MVDPDRVRARLRRLERLLVELEQVRAGGEDAYLRDETSRTLTERWLQLAEQIVIDLGAQLQAESRGRTPKDYGDIFTALAEGDDPALPAELASSLREAAKQRNLLVHDYLELDDRKVFAALDHLDAFRTFAGIVAKRAGRPFDSRS